MNSSANYSILGLLIGFLGRHYLQMNESTTLLLLSQIPSNSFTALLSSQSCFSSAFLALSLSKPISERFFIISSKLASLAYVSVQNFAVFSNFFLSPMYIFATSASCGSLGSGDDSKARSESSAVLMVSA